MDEDFDIEDLIDNPNTGCIKADESPDEVVDDQDEEDEIAAFKPRSNQNRDLSQLTFCMSMCYLCGESLQDPVSLPCGHNFCMNCLNQQMANSEDSHSNSCRICRASFVEYTRRNGAKKLRVNYLLSASLAILQSYVDEVDGSCGDALMHRMLQYLRTTEGNVSQDDMKIVFHRLLNMATEDNDLTIIDTQIKKLQHARDLTKLRLLSLKRAVDESANPSMPTYIKGGLLNGDMVEQAKARLQLPQDLYNLIVIQTDMCDFHKPDTLFDSILSLPIRGITTDRCMVVIQCISQNLDTVINEIIDVYKLTFEGIIATWIEDDNDTVTSGIGGAKRRQRGMNSIHSQLVTVPKTHLFVAASLGPVRALRENNKQNKVIQIKAPALPLMILPNELFTSLTSLLPVYSKRCLIVTGSETITSDRTITLPSGWDVNNYKKQ